MALNWVNRATQMVECVEARVDFGARYDALTHNRRQRLARIGVPRRALRAVHTPGKVCRLRGLHTIIHIRAGDKTQQDGSHALTVMAFGEEASRAA